MKAEERSCQSKLVLMQADHLLYLSKHYLTKLKYPDPQLDNHLPNTDGLSAIKAELHL